jgi:hypothetical protein
MAVDLHFVLEELKARKGQWAQIARDRPEFSYSWLAKLARDEIPDPGIKRIEALEIYLRLLAAQETERRQVLQLEAAGG